MANEGATLTGRVQDLTGAVIPGVTAELTAEDAGGARVRTKTNALGTFAFPGLSPGVYSLTLASAGFHVYRLKGVAVEGAQVVSLPALELSIGGSCEGRPVAEHFRLLPVGAVDGNIGGTIAVGLGPLIGNTPPIRGAEVVLFCAARGRKQPCRRTTSDSHGLFMFKGVPPGSYDLFVSRRGYYTEHGFSYDVQSGLEVVYHPIYLEECVQRGCNPVSRPKRPIQICE